MGIINRLKGFQALELRELILNDDAEAVKLYYEKYNLDFNATFAKDGYITNALLFSASNGRFSVLKMLIKQGVDVNFQDICGRSALFYASRFDDSDVAKSLVEAGANIYLQTNCRTGALHEAAKEGALGVVKIFLEKNVPVDWPSCLGFSALHEAARVGHCDIIKLLVAYGADVDKMNEPGYTPLCYAALSGNLESAQFLIDRGADINKVKDKIDGPLHCAIHSLVQGEAELDMIELLISSGADLKHIGCDKITAIRLAEAYKYPDLKSVLEVFSKSYAARGVKKPRLDSHEEENATNPILDILNYKVGEKLGEPANDFPEVIGDITPDPVSLFIPKFL